MENNQNIPADIAAFVELGAEYIDPEISLTFEESAIAYLRSRNGGSHVCPACGADICFWFDSCKGDHYKQVTAAYCKNCRVKSDNMVFDRYLSSPIALAKIVQSAINQFYERVMKHDEKQN